MRKCAEHEKNVMIRRWAAEQKGLTHVVNRFEKCCINFERICEHEFCSVKFLLHHLADAAVDECMRIVRVHFPRWLSVLFRCFEVTFLWASESRRGMRSKTDDKNVKFVNSYILCIFHRSRANSPADRWTWDLLLHLLQHSSPSFRNISVHRSPDWHRRASKISKLCWSRALWRAWRMLNI